MGAKLSARILRLNREHSFLRLMENDVELLATKIQVNTKVNTRVYTKYNPRKGFTPVLRDWIKALVLNSGVPKDKVTHSVYLIPNHM